MINANAFVCVREAEGETWRLSIDLGELAGAILVEVSARLSRFTEADDVDPVNLDSERCHQLHDDIEGLLRDWLEMRPGAAARARAEDDARGNPHLTVSETPRRRRRSSATPA